jgi:hypothetical protein
MTEFEAQIAGEAGPIVFTGLQLDLGRGAVRGQLHYRDRGRVRQTSQTVTLDQLERCQPFEGDGELALELNESFLRARGSLSNGNAPAAPAPTPVPPELHLGERYLLQMSNGTRYQGLIGGFRDGARRLVIFQLDNGAMIALDESEISSRRPL